MARRNLTRSGAYPKAKMLRRAKNSASRRGLEFSITAGDLILPVYCPVFGIELNYENIGPKKGNSASVDRLDNTRGYVPGNVTIISERANRLKSDATRQELEEIVEWMRKREQYCEVNE